MEIPQKERDRLIKQISNASGVAQYALKQKMTDEQLIQASQPQNLEILALVKDANNFNRYRQRLNTQEANKKLKEFLNPENSELLKAGKWLRDTLSKSGSDRKQDLLEKELVHKEDYNDSIKEMGDTIETLQTGNKEITADAEVIIFDLQKRIDTLRDQLSKIQNYICLHYGESEWQSIKKMFDID